MLNKWLRISCLIVLPLVLLLILFEQRSWQPRVLPIGVPTFTLAFSPNGETLIVGRRKRSWGSLPQDFQFWNVALRQLQQVLPGSDSHLLMAVLAPDEKRIAGMNDTGKVSLWNVQTGKLERILAKPLSKELTTTALAFSPDSQILAEGRGDRGNYSPLHPGKIVIWDLKTGALRHTLSTGGNTVYTFLFSPDGKLLVGGGLYAVQVWDMQSGSLVCKLKEKSMLGPNLAFSNDGKTLASVENWQQVKLWDAKTGNLKRKLGGQKGRVSAIVFAPDGKTMASVSNQIGFPEPPPGATSFSYNGPGVPGHGEVILWNTQTGAKLRTCKNGYKPIDTVTFSPDGQMLAAGSENEVILWQTGNGELLRKLAGQRKTIKALAFSPDGRTLATGSEDQTVSLWRIK